MSTITEYKAVSGETVEELTNLVNIEIGNGFQPFAPISISTCVHGANICCRYSQSLVKVTTE